MSKNNKTTMSKLLYVEDQEDAANLVVAILKKEFNVIKAESVD